MKNLKDKVVVITGAASGIGKALAQQFAKLGSHLALNDFNEEGLLETVKELQSITSGKVFSASFDVSKVENFEKFARQIFEEFGCVDIVINNAGSGYSELDTVTITGGDSTATLRILNIRQLV